MFFPNVAFAWTFIATLLAFLGIASYLDLKTTTIPKSVTVTAVPVALVFNIVRFIWAANNGAVAAGALIASTGTGAAILNGFLFTVLGLLFGFGLFTALWVLGVCGGGDVKLFAAVGAWIGWKFAWWVFVVTLVVVGALILFQGFRLAITGKWSKMRKPGKKVYESKKPMQRLITFALPLTVATAIYLGLKFQHELGLVPPKPAEVNHAN
jgi:Flp pilus assembly protein protease CpaA